MVAVYDSINPNAGLSEEQVPWYSFPSMASNLPLPFLCKSLSLTCSFLPQDMASFLQELLLIFIQCPSVPVLSDVPRHRVISACPPWPGGTAGICSLQYDAHASVGISHAVSSALSYPAFGKALRAFLRAQIGWQNDRPLRPGNGDYIHKCSL